MAAMGTEAFSATRTCGPSDPLYYAGAGGDFNPIHVDDDFARAQGLPGKILQGLCTLSWLVEAVVERTGDPRSVATVSTRFHRPVLVGDEVTFAFTPAGGESPDLDVRVTNQRGEDVLKNAVLGLRPDPSDVRPSTAPPGDGDPYGPFRYAVGAEKVREFAQAIHGAAPSRIYRVARDGLPARYALPDDALVPPPTFCVNFAIQPFLDACTDPARGIDFARVVHGEQAFTFGRPPRCGEVVETAGRVVKDFEKGGHRVLAVDTASRGEDGGLVVAARWTAVVRRP